MWGVRVGRNVTVVFRPALFHNTVTKETRFTPEQHAVYACACVTGSCLSVSASLLLSRVYVRVTKLSDR